MATITAIKPQRSGKRMNIYLDGRFSFGIDLENYVKLGLKVEQELTDKQIIKIVKEAEYQKTLNKLLRFVTLRPRSKREIEFWLKKKKIHESVHEDLFERLTQLELLDDIKFARWWIEQRQQFRPKSIRELTYELRQKGINNNLIEDTMASANVDEIENIKKLLEKNKGKWERLRVKEKERKIQEFLGRKGFSWDLVKKATKKAPD